MANESNKTDFLDEMELMLSPERVNRAHINADKEIFKIRLSELRRNRGIKQNEVSGFSQSSISRIESRKDMKISTLIEYLEDIGLGIEIKVYPKTSHNKNNEVTLLKV